MRYPTSIPGSPRIIARWLAAEQHRAVEGSPEAVRVLPILSRRKTGVAIKSQSEACAVIRSAHAVIHTLQHERSRTVLFRLREKIARTCGLEADACDVDDAKGIAGVLRELREPFIGVDREDLITRRLYDLCEISMPREPGPPFDQASEAMKRYYHIEAGSLLDELEDCGYVAVDRAALQTAITLLLRQLERDQNAESG
jgi:hypothetical protein